LKVSSRVQTGQTKCRPTRRQNSMLH